MKASYTQQECERAQVMSCILAEGVPPGTPSNALALALFRVFFAGDAYGYARAAQEKTPTMSVDGLMLAAQMDAVTGRTETTQTAVGRVVEALID